MRRATDQTKTLVDLLRALDNKCPVTITYLKEMRDSVTGRKAGELVETVRTIEVYDAQVTGAGNIVLVSMDRESRERRTWRLDRITHYTVHRMAFLVPREAESPQIDTVGLSTLEERSDRLADLGETAEMRGLADLAWVYYRASDDLIWAASLVA
jgi:predicted DNA-binding transcriptional regulator YafY